MTKAAQAEQIRMLTARVDELTRAVCALSMTHRLGYLLDKFDRQVSQLPIAEQRRILELIPLSLPEEQDKAA